MKNAADPNNECLIDDFAVRSFRDIADEDYIAARMAFRAALVEPSLWASQQTIEKYLKCILLLNRIPAPHVKHDLAAALDEIKKANKFDFELTAPTREFIAHVDAFGPNRYLQVSTVIFGKQLTSLDHTVWELRRYCTTSEIPKKPKLQQGVIPPKIRLNGGHLEKVIDNINDPARAPLLWQNAFFGRRARRRVKRTPWLKAINAPLYLNPQILNEILEYVYLEGPIIEGYRKHKKPAIK